MQSAVEKTILTKTEQKLKYEPEEKIGVIVAESFPELGLITALRFLEWVQENPEGVISLPTGKTPEYFIKNVVHLLETWNSKETRGLLESWGMASDNKPQMRGLHFVQIDEFYPIEPIQQNSFYYYVNKYYIQQFGLDINRSQLIDCSKIGIPNGKKLIDIWPDLKVDLSLRHRHPSTNLENLQRQVIEDIDQWCFEYEERIRDLGGLGFFLGGIGPDGHIAFNIAGSDHHSVTRMMPVNYETQATAATDLGGIEVAKNRLAITIGLKTIVQNPKCTAIIMAAGEAKASVVANAVCQPSHIRYPATVLHQLQNARFFLTNGAAKYLRERNFQKFKKDPEISDTVMDRIVINLALKYKKRICDLTKSDFKQNRFSGELFTRKDMDVQSICQVVYDRLIDKVKAGYQVRKSCSFLHTAPHHDDIMLGYFPSVVRHIRDASNSHTFAYLTSGFTAVTNQYTLDLLTNLKKHIQSSQFKQLKNEGYFQPSNIHAYNRDVLQYLDGVAANHNEMKREGEARRILRNLIMIFEDEDFKNIEYRIDELINYLTTQYAGKKDLNHIQKLKGMIREWEADCLWAYLGFDHSSVEHLRLGFYKGDIFSEEPTIERDVKPILKLLHRIKPNVVTVALDPEASGPDTHYKVMQAVAEALRQYEKKTRVKDIEVWGYRNVWFRFHPSETNLYVPVSLNMFAILENAFKNAFVSQKDASFPSYEYDGPFSGLAQKIQVEQYVQMKTCLGRSFFHEHPSPFIRATRGFVYLKKMTLNEFYDHARELKKSTETG